MGKFIVKCWGYDGQLAREETSPQAHLMLAAYDKAALDRRFKRVELRYLSRDSVLSTFKVHQRDNLGMTVAVIRL